MRPDELVRWTNSASRGASVVYYRGFLARDCDVGFGARTRHVQDVNRATRRMAQSLEHGGLISLVQRRVGYEDWEYIAQRTRKVTPPQVRSVAQEIRDAFNMMPTGPDPDEHRLAA